MFLLGRIIWFGAISLIGLWLLAHYPHPLNPPCFEIGGMTVGGKCERDAR